MSEGILIVIAIIFTMGNIGNLKNEMPGKLSNISNVIFWGSILIAYFFEFNPVMIVGCILGSITIILYKCASTLKFGIVDIIPTILDILNKSLITYGIVNQQYSFALLSLVTLYTFTIILALFVGYMESKKGN